MPTVSVELDTTKFAAAVTYVFENSRKLVPEIMNRGLLVAIIGGSGVDGAMQRTPKAAKESILSLAIKLIAGYVMNKHKGEKMTRQQMYALIDKEVKRRISAIAYTARVGWNNAAIAFGGHGIGKRASGIGYAKEGYGIPVSEVQWPFFTAEMVNAAPAAVLIGEQPLQDALDDAAEDMVHFMEMRLQEVFNTV